MAAANLKGVLIKNDFEEVFRTGLYLCGYLYIRFNAV